MLIYVERYFLEIQIYDCNLVEKLSSLKLNIFTSMVTLTFKIIQIEKHHASPLIWDFVR